MLNKATLLACVAAALAPRAVTADSCQEISGNYYCNAATAITYENVGFSGEYSDITAMDESSGSCSYSTDDFSGTLAPLNEEVSSRTSGRPLTRQAFAPLPWPAPAGQVCRIQPVERLQREARAPQALHPLAPPSPSH